MRTPTLDLEAVDHAWYALRDTMLRTQAQRADHASQLAKLLNEEHSPVDWSVGDATDILKEFRNIAMCIGAHAQESFASDGLNATLDYQAVVDTYMEKKDNGHTGRERETRDTKLLQTLNVRVLWDLLSAHFPEEEVKSQAISQAGAALREAFEEFSRWRRKAQPIQRIAGAEILTQHLYGSTYELWKLEWSRRDRVKNAFEALCGALVFAGEPDTAQELRLHTGFFLHKVGLHEWTYRSRQREKITEELTLVFFKDKVQFHLSEKLATAVKLLLIETQPEVEQ